MNDKQTVKLVDCPPPIQIVTKMEVEPRTTLTANTDLHEAVNHGITITKAYQCNHCYKSFEKKQNLIKHWCPQFDNAVEQDGNIKHPRNLMEKKPYCCRYCAKTFTTYDYLERHLMIHAREKPYQCCYCDKTFSNTQNFDAHHGECDTRKHKIHTTPCSTCHMYLSQDSYISSHLTKHTGMKVDKTYHCSYCNKEFTRKSLLIIHMRKHNGERPYQCNYCGKGFTEKSNLTRHLKIHTGERQYQCSYCGKAFSQNGDLKKHIMTHTGEKPHQCSYCKKTFTEKRTLVTHYRTHTGEKPYKCKQCNKAFTQKGNLAHHMRKHNNTCSETMDTENSDPINSDMNTFKAHRQVTQTNETYTQPISLNISNKTFSDSRIDIISEMAYAAACMAEEVNPNKFRKVMNQYFMINNLPLINKSVSDQEIKKIHYSKYVSTNSNNTTSVADVPELSEEPMSLNKEIVSALLEESILANTENVPLNTSSNNIPTITVSAAQDECILENAPVLSISDLHFSSDMIEIQI